jgi:uncharacterized repeat protein (TIGR01451 family)
MRSTFLLLLLPVHLFAQQNGQSASALSNSGSLTKLSPEKPLTRQNDPQLTAKMNAQMTAQRPAAVFEENKGQMKDQHWQPRPDVLFNGSANGLAYYVRDNGMSYQLSRVESWKEEEDDRFDMPGREKRQVPDEMGTYRVDVQWTDFNTDYTVEKGTELEGYTNYYNVPEGAEPALFVKQYGSVTLRGLYDGIDLHLYGTDGHLETDWLVAPGADYTQISFEVKGAALSVDTEGHLIMGTPFGEIREGTLKVFQEGRQLEAYWRLSALTDSSGTVSFEVMGHDPMLAMRIDPVVRVWGTYYGGAGGDYGYSCAVDGSGNVFLAGATTSGLGGGIISSGGHQMTHGSGSPSGGSDQNFDAFLVKLNSLGIREWATFYGGSYLDIGRSCAVDLQGNVFMSGRTYSPNNIAYLGHQNSHGDPYPGYPTAWYHDDAFLVKFNSEGVRLWGTYYGDQYTDIGNSCATDQDGNVYMAGECRSTNLASGGHQNTYGGGNLDAFLVKFNPNGIRLWATYYGGAGWDHGYSCATDHLDNVYLAGWTSSPTGIALGGHQMINGGGERDAFLVKFNSQGVRQWGTYLGGEGADRGNSCAVDGEGNAYLVGYTESVSGISFSGHQTAIGGVVDGFLAKFDPNGTRLWASYYGGDEDENITACSVDVGGNLHIAGYTRSSNMIAAYGFLNQHQTGYSAAFLSKFSPSGNRQWGTYYGGTNTTYGYGCAVDHNGNSFLVGETRDADLISYSGHQNNIGGSRDAFLVSFRSSGIWGQVFHDFDQNCVQSSSESQGISTIGMMIQPGGIVLQTNNSGVWQIDSLPAGDYTVTIDTTNSNWTITCPLTQLFTVVHPDSFLIAPSFGMISTNPCPSPDVSIVMPQMRRGFANQVIYVSACNEPLGTGTLEDAYSILELDEHISVQSSSLPFIALGGNRFQFNIGDLLPGQCLSFTLSATVELTAVANQTLCLSAELYPQPDCVFDTVPNPYPPTVAPCDGAWDGSSLTVEAHCDGDSVHFTVMNTGEDMACFAPVRVYVNGNQVILDSLMLAGGDSAVLTYLGNGQTWRLEADQHPYHPGSSNPSAHMEICGSSGFLPFIVTMFPQDDADPVIDIFCDEVSAPLDPNDKTGSPRGLGETHAIQQNQQIEYLVRFQNIGTDTAVNVVILDTLSTDLNIFTVQSGVSSHPYEFRMYGPRVLEWRFNNIMLPDSTADGPGSNGFVMFKVQQVPNLPFGTLIENTANIYFDFEDPVITNTYIHTVTDFSGTLFPAPEAGLVHQGASALCDGQAIILSATLGQGYLWSTGETTQSITVGDEGEYWVTVSYQDGTESISPTMTIATVSNPTVVMTDVEEGLNILSPPVELEGTPTGGTFTGTAVSGNMFDPSEAGLGEHCLTYTYTDEVGCEGADVHCVMVDFAVGAENGQAVTFTVFPNPGNGLFTLVTSEGGAVRLTVTDISGREVFQESYTATPGTAHSIDISKQANGIYTLRIETEKGNGGVRLVKE